MTTGDDITALSFLCKADLVPLNFCDTGIGEDIDLVSRESGFRIFGQGLIIGIEDVVSNDWVALGRLETILTSFESVLKDLEGDGQVRRRDTGLRGSYGNV
ncbi:hypothetical protein PG985_005868 [Apiospora marii]|uniref:uncharacterized protein n=1 Tax=Apiospora marii TaxID=335849 RepID=UPI00312F56E7